MSLLLIACLVVLVCTVGYLAIIALGALVCLPAVALEIIRPAKRTLPGEPLPSMFASLDYSSDAWKKGFWPEALYE